MKDRIYHFIIVLVFISSCSKENRWDCLKSTGDIITEERTISSEFTAIQTTEDINVVITQGTENKVLVEAGENLMSLITTEVKNTTLVLDNNNKCNWVRGDKHDIYVYVTLKDLTRIIHNGYGKVSGVGTITTSSLTFDINGNGDLELDIDVDYCYAEMHKAGDLILTGKARALGIWTSDNNWVRCSNLITDTVAIDLHTTGDGLVYCTQFLKASIHNSGDIVYYGNPLVKEFSNVGSGEFIAK